MVVTSYLGVLGHEVVEAENGLRCLETLDADNAFDAILMDVQMPEMDGVAATRAIKAEGSRHRHLPVIGLTANAFDDQRRDYLAAGMDDCLIKPIDWAHLLVTLARFTNTATAGGDRPVAPKAVGKPASLDEDALRALIQSLGYGPARDIVMKLSLIHI